MLMRRARIAIRTLRGNTTEPLIPPYCQKHLGVPRAHWSECPALMITSRRHPNAVDLSDHIRRHLPPTGSYTQDEILEGLAAAYVDAGCADVWLIGRQWLSHYGVAA